MKILGIHVGHDSGAALVRDGAIVADVSEERFVRIKHYCGLPVRSIEYCLASQGLAASDIDLVAIPTIGSLPELNFLLGLSDERRERISFGRQAIELARGAVERSGVMPPIYTMQFPIGRRTEIMHVEHHLAHAAAAYYTSGSPEKQLIVTIDGAGDNLSVGIWRGENGRIERLHAVSTSGSLGWFYGNVTEALGWWHGDGEGKTMGLAPYGDDAKCRGALDRFVPKYDSGLLVRSHDFGRAFHWDEAGATHWHLAEAAEIRDVIAKFGRDNVAAEAQRVLEEEVKNIVFPWMERERTRNLSAAGGVMLNVKLNQRLWETGRLARHHTFPNAGDSGLAVGAALYAHHQMSPDAPIGAIEHLYLGPEYGEAEIESLLKLRGLEFRKVADPANYAAGRLAEGKIVAWFQGRMESGPRALGARSILMSANRAENKDIINARVKFREAFRPFCPSMLSEKKDDYLELARDEPFMITSFTCKEHKRGKVPAVVHADSTLRPQTVTETANPRFWRLINEFGNLTGEYLVLNTSLNIMGEPIVNHPREAVRCFYDNGLDVLVLGDYVLEKVRQG